MIRLLIVDDHALVRQGVRALLEQEPRFEVVGEAGEGGEAIRLAEKLRPNVVLMDINLPGGLGGLEAAEELMKRSPSSRVIMLTQYRDREYVRRALQIGAAGFLPKSGVADQLRDAILAVHDGRRYIHPDAAEELVTLLGQSEPLTTDDYERLSSRERQVLKLLAEGKTSREVAKYLGISPKTAMTHRAHVMEKLNLHSRTELIKYAIRKRVIEV